MVEYFRCGDEGDAVRRGKVPQRILTRHVTVEVMPRQTNVESPGKSCAQPGYRGIRRKISAVINEECNDSRRKGTELLPSHRREALRITQASPANKLAEVGVSGVIRCKQNYRGAAACRWRLRRVAGSYGDFGAVDDLHAVLDTGEVCFDGAVKPVAVGYRDCRETELGGTGHKLFRMTGTLGEGVIAFAPERGVRHVGLIRRSPGLTSCARPHHNRSTKDHRCLRHSSRPVGAAQRRRGATTLH